MIEILPIAPLKEETLDEIGDRLEHTPKNL